MPGLLYRVQQFVRAVRTPPLSPTEAQRAHDFLGDRAFALYQTMPRGDQRHALNIFDALVAQGYRDRPLLEAALLHDVAKRNLGLGYRTGVIFLNRLSSDALARVGRPNPADWRYPFYVSLHHPEMGAELAARAGVTEPTLTLIRAHQSTQAQFQHAPFSDWQRALKALDDVN